MVGGLYYSDSRVNAVTSLRGNAVLAAWRAYDENRIYEENGNEVHDWFGRKVDGPLGLCMSVDKTTGQLRSPVANINARITGGSDIRGSLAIVTQVVNNFVTVQARSTFGSSRRAQGRGLNFSSNGQRRNMQQSQIPALRPFVENFRVTFVIPLGTTIVKDILKQRVSTD